MSRSFCREAQRVRRSLPAAPGGAGVEAVERLSASAPQTGAAALQLGELWLGQGRTEEARSWLDRSLRLAPGHLPARVLATLVACDQGQWDEARRKVESVLKDRPDHEFAQALRCYVAWREKNDPEALRALSRSPFVYDQHLGGRVLFHVERPQLGQSKGRLADLFAELNVSPLGRWMYPVARWGRRIHATLQHPLSARKRREAVALVEASGLLAVGRPAEAAARVARALDGAPSSADMGILMGEILLAGGELSRLGELLTLLAQRDATLADTPEYQLLSGVMLAEKGQYRDAEAALARVPDDPWNLFPYYYRGLAATGLDKPVDARRWFARALDICTIQLVHRRLARQLTSNTRRKH